MPKGVKVVVTLEKTPSFCSIRVLIFHLRLVLDVNIEKSIQGCLHGMI
jgi:hypothetical protein